MSRFWADRNGATAIEYGLICALIVLAILASVSALGDSAVGLFAIAENWPS